MASMKFVLACAFLATLAISLAQADEQRSLKTIKLGGLKDKIFGGINYDYDHKGVKDFKFGHYDHDGDHDDGKKFKFQYKHDDDKDDHKRVVKVFDNKKRCEDECHCYYIHPHYFKRCNHGGCKVVVCDCDKYSHAVFKKVKKCH